MNIGRKVLKAMKVDLLCEILMYEMTGMINLI